MTIISPRFTESCAILALLALSAGLAVWAPQSRIGDRSWSTSNIAALSGTTLFIRHDVADDTYRRLAKEPRFDGVASIRSGGRVIGTGGDSGGSVFADVDGVWSLIGIFATTRYDTSRKVLQAYGTLNFVTRIGEVADWIDETIQTGTTQALIQTPRRLTNVINAYPNPSPDGERVVFQSNRSDRWELYVMNIDGSGFTKLTDRPGDNVTPAWSPDGKLIAFAASPGGNSDIYIMKSDGSDLRRLTEYPGDDSHPHWSADGSRIIFNSERATPGHDVDLPNPWEEIFSVKLDGTDLRQHTSCKAVCTYPSFSPDGTKIVFRKITDTPGYSWDLSNISRNSEVFVATVDGSNEINLSNSAAFDGWPAWSPDGKQIVFASNRAGPANVGQLYLVNIDGTGLRKITSGPWSYVQPAWSRDGRKIFAYQNQETAEYEFGDVVVIDVPDAEAER